MDNNINGFDYENIDKYIELIRSQNSRWNMIPSHYYTKYNVKRGLRNADGTGAVSYTHLRAHETGRNLVCRLLLEKKKKTKKKSTKNRSTKKP